jgi:hypothetical protein
MSKSVVLLIALLIILGIVPTIAIKPARCTEVISQNFDDEPTGAIPQGWDVQDSSICSLNVSDTVYFGSSGKSAKFTDDSNMPFSYVRRDFPGQYGYLVFSFAVMVEVPDYFDVLIHDGFGHGANIYFMPGGVIAYYESYEWHGLCPFSIGTWYQFKMAINMQANTYDIYIDGSLKASEARFNGFGAAFSLSRIELGGQSPETPVGYIDNLSLSAEEYVAPPTTIVTMTGSLDYLFQEDVKVRLAAIVKNAETMEMISDATVIIEIYYPNGSLWVSDTMTEKLTGTGIYEWESPETINQMNLEKGVYLARTQGSTGGSSPSTDILLFHIDPPAETPMATFVPYIVFAISVIAAVATSMFLLRSQRKKSMKTGVIRL